MAIEGLPSGTLVSFVPVPISDEARAILERVYARRQSAAKLPFLAVSAGAWRPQPQQCFDNVNTWVRLNPSLKAVLGFIVCDYRPFAMGFVRFVPHAVVEVEDGKLVDITPPGLPADRPFIRHTGTWDQIVALVVEQGRHSGLDVEMP